MLHGGRQFAPNCSDRSAESCHEFVGQYNPEKTYALPRKEWRKAHLVIGKYNRAN